MPDRYTYPGSHVLANLHGYHDPDLWKAAERRVVHAHLADLVERPISGSFDLRHLQAIHAYLVQGFYSWGGQLRATDTGPGGTGIAHCRPSSSSPRRTGSSQLWPTRSGSETAIATPSHAAWRGPGVNSRLSIPSATSTPVVSLRSSTSWRPRPAG